MSDEVVLLEFEKFHFSKTDYLSLPSTERMLLSLSCFAVSEINVFQKLHVLSGYSEDEVDSEIYQVVILQQLAILRIWAAKSFEYKLMLQKFEVSRRNKNLDPLLDGAQNVVTMALRKFDELNNSHFSILKVYRDHAISHYLFDHINPAGENISEDVDICFYTSEQRENCFFPLGEVVCSTGILQENLMRDDSGDTLQGLRGWLGYVNDLAGWAIDSHRAIMDNIFMAHFPERRAESCTLRVSRELVGSTGESRVPIFLRSEK